MARGRLFEYEHDQMGGLTRNRASKELGKVHMPSPQINPEATAGANASALALFNLRHIKRIKLPRHMSMVK
ncbi:hypothetical protein AKJ16_DCAP09279 [Drosera capensis]